VAGGAALNELIAGSRISRDIDLFHDTDAAVGASWDADRRLLQRHGFDVHLVRERPSYVEAEVNHVPPAEEIGKCVLTRRGEFLTLNAEDAMGALARGEILFHAGRIRGAFPRITSR